MSTHSSCKKTNQHYLRSSSKELLQSSPTSRYAVQKQTVVTPLNRKMYKQKERDEDIASDYDSCSSSLQSLNFDSDSDHRENFKENVLTKRNSLSARKKLQFESLTNVDGMSFQSPDDKNQKSSPLSILKTPLINIVTATTTPPRRSHGRRSLLPMVSNISPESNQNESDASKRQANYNKDSEHHSKHSKSEPPKARLSLFSSPSPTSFIPARSFYSKSEKQATDNNSVEKINSANDSKASINKKRGVRGSRNSLRRSSMSNRHLRQKLQTGINRGVRHGIKKPKLNKKPYVTKTNALKMAINLMDNSPLNDYIDEFMGYKSSNGPIVKKPLLNTKSVEKTDSTLKSSDMNNSEDIIFEFITNSDTEEQADETVPSKKIFKSSKKIKTVATVHLPHVKLQLQHGKLQMPKRKTNRSYVPSNKENLAELYMNMQNDVNDLLNDEEDVIEKSNIDNLIEQWPEEDVPDDEPQSYHQTGDIYKNIKGAELFLQSKAHMTPLSQYSSEGIYSIVGDDGSIHSLNEHNSDTNSTDTAYVSDSSQQQLSGTFQFLPVGDGYILVEDTEISGDSEIPSDMNKIESELEVIEKSIADIAKNNNLNPEILLSPTAQMCSMTSDLMLTSPTVVATNGNFSSNSRNPTETKCQKLYPLFDKLSNIVHTTKRKLPELSMKFPTPPTKKSRLAANDQYIIDAGQKKFGATKCTECGVVYQIGDAIDEADHLTHHTAADILKFSGWKTERLCGRWGEGRVIVVAPGDPASHWQRVYNLLERVVHPQLGYAVALQSEKSYKVYLYIEKKVILGCLVAEVLKEAHKFVYHQNMECCSNEVYPVKCGVSRIWTHKAHRRKRIATNLINSMRVNFMFGHVLLCDEIAFSSPTPLGKAFAQKYMGVSDFFVYLN